MINGFMMKEKPKKAEREQPVIDEHHDFTADELKNMVKIIATLEEHERIQLYHLIEMYKIPYTKQNDGILLNIDDETDKKFISEIYVYVMQCVDDHKYRTMF